MNGLGEVGEGQASAGCGQECGLVAIFRTQGAWQSGLERKVKISALGVPNVFQVGSNFTLPTPP